MICLQMFNMDFFDFPISITLIVVWMNEFAGESRISRGSAFHKIGPAAQIENLRTSDFSDAVCKSFLHWVLYGWYS